MMGWPQQAESVAAVFHSLPQQDQARAAILTKNYGQAGAIDFLGPRYGLPPALSGHQSWWLWGPRGYSGNCLIVLDDERERLETLFQSVEYVGDSPHNPYALEDGLSFYICRGAKFGTLSDLWPKLKRWR